jgi:hypothetical protein
LSVAVTRRFNHRGTPVDLIENIKAAYERDLHDDASAVTAERLPRSFEAMTDEWLTAVLCAGVKHARVLGYALGAVDNGSSNRRRMRVEYNAEGCAAGLPTALFCKASHDLANRILLGVSGAARCESHFYRNIRPLLSIEAPRAYFAYYDAATYNSLVMLEDLSDSVREFCNDRTGMTLDRARSQMRLLATMHGACKSDQRLVAHVAALPSWSTFFENTVAMGMREGSSSGFLAAEAAIPARLFKRFDDIWPATLRSVELLSREPCTLAHGDVHLKNWYVAGNGEMGLGDWQCCTRSHWGRDFAYTIATALLVEDRRAWERDLLALYLDGLRAAGAVAPSFDEAWIIYRQQLVTALTWWTVTLTPAPGMPDMQPRDTTLAFIERIATAMDDLDTLATLQV